MQRPHTSSLTLQAETPVEVVSAFHTQHWSLWQHKAGANLKDSLSCTTNVTNMFTSLMILKHYKRFSKINRHSGFKLWYTQHDSTFISTLQYNLVLLWINKLNLYSACSKIQGCKFPVHSCWEVSSVTKAAPWQCVAAGWRAESEVRAFRQGSGAVQF